MSLRRMAEHLGLREPDPYQEWERQLRVERALRLEQPVYVREALGLSEIEEFYKGETPPPPLSEQSLG